MALIRSVALVCLACLLSTHEARAGEPKPPRNALAFESSSSSPNGVGLTLASATLRKGKKGRILRVDLRVHFEDAMAFTINGFASLRVNDALVPLSLGGGFGGCGPASSCTVEGYGWLDLDAAEADAPGVFIGEPLVLEVRGNVDAQSLAFVDVSLLAQLLRK